MYRFLIKSEMPCKCEIKDSLEADLFAAGLFNVCIYTGSQMFSFAIGWVATFLFFGAYYP